MVFDIYSYLPGNTFLGNFANRIEAAALFGSIKCFKFLLMNRACINKRTCRFAVAGGNNEIIHLCEQKGLVFENCLVISSFYHRFEIFEWLNIHFNYEEISLLEFIQHYNEPLFYFYSLLRSDVETKALDDTINIASRNGHNEIVKYLYEKYHPEIEYDTIDIASRNGHNEIVKYLDEIFYAELDEFF